MLSTLRVYYGLMTYLACAIAGWAWAPIHADAPIAGGITFATWVVAGILSGLLPGVFAFRAVATFAMLSFGYLHSYLLFESLSLAYVTLGLGMMIVPSLGQPRFNQFLHWFRPVLIGLMIIAFAESPWFLFIVANLALLAWLTRRASPFSIGITLCLGLAVQFFLSRQYNSLWLVPVITAFIYQPPTRNAEFRS